MAKKKKQHDEGAKSSWMASYTDLVTVLFALFVMLYALSEVDEALWDRFAAAAAARFGTGEPYPFEMPPPGLNLLMGSGMMGMPDLPLPIFERPQTTPADPTEVERAMHEAYTALQTYFGYDAAAATEAIIFEFDEEGMTLTITAYGGTFFDSGVATIRPGDLHILDAIGSAIQIVGNVVEMDIDVVGHTDNVPINTVQFPSNWWLGSARATNVMLYLINEGFINPEVSMVGARSMGEYQPVADNATFEGRQQNRRVEIIIRPIMPIVLDDPMIGLTVTDPDDIYVDIYEDAEYELEP